MITFLKEIIGKLVAKVTGFSIVGFLGWMKGMKDAESRQLKKNLEAEELRRSVEDDIALTRSDDARKRLRKWTMPGMETDKTNDG